MKKFGIMTTRLLLLLLLLPLIECSNPDKVNVLSEQSKIEIENQEKVDTFKHKAIDIRIAKTLYSTAFEHPLTSYDQYTELFFAEEKLLMQIIDSLYSDEENYSEVINKIKLNKSVLIESVREIVISDYEEYREVESPKFMFLLSLKDEVIFPILQSFVCDTSLDSIYINRNMAIFIKEGIDMNQYDCSK